MLIAYLRFRIICFGCDFARGRSVRMTVQTQGIMHINTQTQLNAEWRRKREPLFSLVGEATEPLKQNQELHQTVSEKIKNDA